MSKVDLTLLNRLVNELAKQLDMADKIDSELLLDDYIVEMGKAMGIASTISTEATGLVSDILKTMAESMQQEPQSAEDLLSSFIGKKKPLVQ